MYFLKFCVGNIFCFFIGMGFFIDVYDLFFIFIVMRFFGWIYYYDFFIGKFGSLFVNVNVVVNGVVLCGILVG